MSQLIRAGESEEAERLKAQAREIGTALAALEPQLEKLDVRFKDLMLLVPNIVSPDTPIGASDADNVEIKRVGTPPSFHFEPQDVFVVPSWTSLSLSSEEGAVLFSYSDRPIHEALGILREEFTD